MASTSKSNSPDAIRFVQSSSNVTDFVIDRVIKNITIEENITKETKIIAMIKIGFLNLYLMRGENLGKRVTTTKAFSSSI